MRIIAASKEKPIFPLSFNQLASTSRTYMVRHLHFVLGDILPYVLHVVDLSVWIGNYGFAKLLCKTLDAVGSKRDCLMIQYIFAQLCGIKNRACSAAV